MMFYEPIGLLASQTWEISQDLIFYYHVRDMLFDHVCHVCHVNLTSTNLGNITNIIIFNMFLTMFAMFAMFA